jgi:hypothetical protein
MAAQVESAGKRGFGVFVAPGLAGEPEFVLQHRALNPGRSLDTGEETVSLVTDAVIQFCPWCGTRLSRFYRRCVEQLLRPGLRVPLG